MSIQLFLSSQLGKAPTLQQLDANFEALRSPLTGLGLENLTDPGADRLVFWDDSEGSWQYLTPGSGLSLSGATLSVGDLSGTYATLSGATFTGSVEFENAISVNKPSGSAFIELHAEDGVNNATLIFSQGGTPRAYSYINTTHFSNWSSTGNFLWYNSEWTEQIAAFSDNGVYFKAEGTTQVSIDSVNIDVNSYIQFNDNLGNGLAWRFQDGNGIWHNLETAYYLYGLQLRAASTTSGKAIFTVASSGQSERLRVEHDGYLATSNNKIAMRYTEGGFSNNDSYIYFCSDAYIHWDESQDWFTLSKGMRFVTAVSFSDQTQCRFGNDLDAWIYHSGNDFVFRNQTGAVYFQWYNGSSYENMVRMIGSGAVEVFCNNAKKFETTNFGFNAYGYGYIAQSDNTPSLVLENTYGGVTTNNILLLRIPYYAGSTSMYWINCVSDWDDSPNSRFKVGWSGTVYSDGGGVATPADYAEMLEWEDGNPDGEDRTGVVVVLCGEKIRPITGDDFPEEAIGVVSANPSYLGNAAWSHWNERELKDDLGRYVMEDITVATWDEWLNGEEQHFSYVLEDHPEGTPRPVPEYAEIAHVQRRKENPDWDPELEYVPRQDRPEWDAVGLVGILRAYGNQPVNPRWLKMRDITDEIAEYLVR